MKKTPDFTLIPTLQIRPNYLLLYNIIDPMRRGKRDPWQGGLANFKKTLAYQGLLSKGSKKNLKRSIENLIAIAKEKEAYHHKFKKSYKWTINFITLTLPCPQGKYSDKEVKRLCLDTWLKSAKRRFKLGSYVWRAERQLNGNVHFHIMCDTYIDKDNLRHSWNDRLEHCSYVSQFHAKHGHRDPNSTDVHSVSKIKNLAAYMIKYMCKSADSAEQYRAQPPWTKAARQAKDRKQTSKWKRLLSLEESKINGRLWDCSTNLKQKIKCDFIIDTEIGEMIERAINVHECKYKVTENCSLVFMEKDQFEKVVTGRLRDGWDKWKEQIRTPIHV